MTTTPDIREKVARAICAAENETDIALNQFVEATWREHLPAADSAILAIGYQEMREALENLVADCDEYERINNLAPAPGKSECWASIAAARSALEKTR